MFHVERNKPRRFSIYGPPGCGKTHTIEQRIRGYIDSGVPQERIGLMSFTKAGARELAKRAGLNTEWASTIHSAAYRVSGVTADQVIDNAEMRKFAASIGIRLTGQNPDVADRLQDGDEYWSLFQLAGARCAGLKQTYGESHRPGTFGQYKYFCKMYMRFKESYGQIDFNDMLSGAAQFSAPDLDVLFIDEAQDLSPLQWRLICHWTRHIPHVHIAGDDDQAIFVWSGADPLGMQKWESEFGAEREVLGQSYRIPSKVHTAAEALISRVRGRVPKEYRPRDETGRLDRLQGSGSIRLQHGEDTMVLYRNHSLRSDLEQLCVRRGLPYRCIGGRPGALHDKTAAAALKYIKVVHDLGRGRTPEMSDAQLGRWARTLRGAPAVAVRNRSWGALRHTPWWRAVVADKDQMLYLVRVWEKYGSLDIEPTIRFNTIHGVKGAEADRVILLNDMSKRTEAAMSLDRDSEVRTMYVGLTRARHSLQVINGPRGIRV